VTTAYQLKTTAFPMKKSVPSKEIALESEFNQKKWQQQKTASNSAM
jgi:hypothetical protein